MARTIYIDSSLSLEDQIDLLKSRRLNFEDEEHAKHILQNVSMFRMKGYLYPLQEDKVNHIYKDGATFEQAFELYRFDSDLRRLLFKRIEQIEVSIRTKFGEIMATAVIMVTLSAWSTRSPNLNNIRLQSIQGGCPKSIGQPPFFRGRLARSTRAHPTRKHTPKCLGFLLFVMQKTL